jgi:hypothetical protein
MHLEHLFDALDVVVGLAEMRFESLLQGGVACLLDHVRQRLLDLLLGVVDIPQRGRTGRPSSRCLC